MAAFAIFYIKQFRNSHELCLPCNFFWINSYARVFSYKILYDLMNKLFEKHLKASSEMRVLK